MRHTYPCIVVFFFFLGGGGGWLNVSMTSQIDKCPSQQLRLLHVIVIHVRVVIHAESENLDNSACMV